MKRLVPSRLYGDYAGQVAHFTRPLENGCWEFTGFILPNGYGQLGRNLMAHRVAWEAANGPIPEGMILDHLCHTRDLSCVANTDCPHRRCVNPAHLEPVTSQINNLRGRGFANTNAAKTHCANGHEFTEDNTYWRPDRYGRICRTCRDETLRRGRHKWARSRAA